MFEMFEDETSEFYEPEYRNQKKLLLFDGPYSTFRAFYGYDAERFRKQDGTATNCLFGVSKTLLTLVKQECPTHMAFAFDVSKHDLKRKQLLPQYKDGRKDTPTDLINQFPLIRQMLDVAQVPHLQEPALEADDIIATLAHQAVADGFEVRIFSSDKDMYQLVNDKINILRPRIGSAGFDLVTPAVVEKKYGVKPEQYPDLAALIGESADNIPGVTGVGPKTALKWILEYKNLENLLNNANQISGKVGDNLRAHIDQVRINRQVNELIKNAELSKSVDDLELRTPPLEAVNNFFWEWEMPSLVNRFKW